MNETIILALTYKHLYAQAAQRRFSAICRGDFTAAMSCEFEALYYHDTVCELSGQLDTTDFNRYCHLMWCDGV